MGRVKDGPDCVDDAPKFGDAKTSQIVVEIKFFVATMLLSRDRRLRAPCLDSS